MKNSELIVSVEDLPWDSSMLGIKSGLLSVAGESATESNEECSLLRDSLLRAKEQGYRFLTAKVNVERTSLLNACLQNHGKVVDTEITFHKLRTERITQNDKVSEEISIRKYEKYWHDSFKGLSKTIMHSRFFVDTNISSEKAIDLWSQSIYNSCNGRATYSIVGFHNESPVGLMSIFEREGVSDIFFIAVLPEHQSYGIGRAMVKYYESHIGKDIKELTVDTQQENDKALRFYIGMGYRIKSSKQIIHFWL